ncbi:VSP [Giardia lamblia P15]|uniref:VSP n=1 Tax=Giardia intestinalis (strain P15) TaxID=658858 RepID=E1F5E4_GIAIA|nr:VSP [Giardia lamblia P15]
MLLVALYFAMSTLAADCQPDGDHAATCKSGSCEMVGGAEICTQCKAGGVPIDGLCRPFSASHAATAGCTKNDGAVLTGSDTTCGKCSGADYFLFMGGCYNKGTWPGNKVCTAADKGVCTTCKVDGKYLFQNPVNPITPGNECVLCLDVTPRDGVMGVASCYTCTAPGGGSGAAACITCQPGYYKEGTGCKKCVAGCIDCNAASQCTTCEDGKYLKTNTCVDASGCAETEYADKKTWSCKACDPDVTGCMACEYNDATGKPKCTNCNGKLIKTAVDGTTTCVDANSCAQSNQAGTHFLSNDNRKCIPCGDDSESLEADKGTPGCKTCTKNGAKPTCSECLDGYYNSADSGTATCEACPGKNCATCDKSTKDKCKTCTPGFFLKDSASGECIPCDDTKNGGSEGCSVCSNNSGFECTDCKPNYYKRTRGRSAVTCEKFCEDPTACGGTAGACEAIVVQDNGDFLHYCSLCGDLNTFPIDGICVKEKSGNTCENGICTQCAAGYFLYMGGCYSAANTPGNLMCKTAEGGKCTAPNENNKYFLVPGAASNQQSVMACENPLGTAVGEKAYVGVEGCDTCTAPAPLTEAGLRPARCTACNTGSGKPNLAGSGCFLCTVGGCSHCSANGVCEACMNKEQRPNTAGTQCISCSIDGCTRCSAENKCDQCGDGYRLEGEACIATKPSGGNRSGLSTGAIAGIAVAVVVVVGGLVGFLCWWFICRGKA